MSRNRKRSSAPKTKAAPRPAKRRYRSQNSSFPVIAGIAALVGIVALIFFLTSNNSSGSSGEIEGLMTFPNLDRSHVTTRVNYPQTPPAGGPHNAAWLNCGVYTEPVPNENAVHSLEHGVVWITYQPDLAAEEVEKLATLTRQSSYRLLSPYPNLPAPVVASAWGYQVHLENADDPRLLAFIDRYEQNPLGPEPGASCSGGVGTPS